jgi:hypothetical protein
LQQSTAATTTLARSLLRPQIADAARELTQLTERLAELHGDAMRRLQQIDRRWTENAAECIAELQQVHQELAYLTRWTAEVAERQLQLGTC